MKQKIICIFGGTGFLGQHITQELAKSGYRIKIATRFPESAYELKTYGDIGQIVPIYCDYNDDESLKKAMQGCDAVINLIGILYERKRKEFQKIHADLAEKIAKAAQNNNVEKYVHLSAIGVDKTKSKYARSKLKGDQAVQYAFPKATILRPSVVFGPDDNFFNMFAKLSTFLPALPLIGGGKTKFQPVYVGDVAAAVTNIINDKTGQFNGKTYELGGPKIVTLKEVYETILTYTNRQCSFISIPFPIAKLQGFILGLLPKPLLTMDQVTSLKTDNIVQDGALTLKDLGVEPTAMEIILPQYLICYQRGGRFANKNAVKKKT